LAVGLVVCKFSYEFLTVYVVLDAESVTNAVAFGLSLVDMPEGWVYLGEIGVVEGTLDGLCDFVLHPAHHYFFCWLIAFYNFRPPCWTLSVFLLSVLLIAFVTNGVDLFGKSACFCALL